MLEGLLNLSENPVSLKSYMNNGYFHKTVRYLLTYSAEYFSEWEKFQKNLVDNIYTHF